MADTRPVAFLSFVSSDFQHEEGRIAQFRERLADEVVLPLYYVLGQGTHARV